MSFALRACLILLILPSLAFEWPGRVSRFEFELSHADAARRREVARQLGRYPAETVGTALLKALEDDDPHVRMEAAASAGQVGLRQAIPILLDWLGHSEPDMRRAAARALGRIGEPRTLEPLARALGDSSADVRHAAVRAVARIGTPEAVTPLLGVLDDADQSVRLSAITALGQLADARAVVPLLSRAQDVDAEVRAATLRALGDIGDGRAVPTLLRALEDEVDAVRFAAVAALGRVGEASAVRALSRLAGAADTRLGRAAVAALGDIDDDAAREALVEQLSRPALVSAATRALQSQARMMESRGSGSESEPEPEPESESESESEAKSEPVRPLVERLSAAAQSPADEPTRIAAARALSAVARVADTSAASAALTGALREADGEGELAAALMLAAARTGDPEVLLPLLERLSQARGEALDPVLRALELYFERSEPDGRAADPLLARLQDASPEQRARIAELLGRVGAARAAPALRGLLDSERPATRLAALRALGALGDRESAGELVKLLDAREARLRMEAARALRASAGEAEVSALLDRLEGREAADRHALMVALGGALRRLEPSLPGPLRARALRSLARVLEGPSEALSDRALQALSTWGADAALPVVAARLRSPSSRARALSARAVGYFDPQQARPVLRYVLREGRGRVVVGAALALGEVGDGRDVAALSRTAERRHWPVPAAAAHGIYRIVARGAVKAHAARRALCELGTSREPHVRANVAAAMAVLGAAPCTLGASPGGEGEEASAAGRELPDPARWLGPGNGPDVRAAAARWLWAAARSGRVDAAAARRALSRCAATDPEPRVRRACEQPRRPRAGEAVELTAYASDRSTLLRDRLISVHLPDGAVFVGYTDDNAEVHVPQVPRGTLTISDPTQSPLER